VHVDNVLTAAHTGRNDDNIQPSKSSNHVLECPLDRGWVSDVDRNSSLEPVARSGIHSEPSDRFGRARAANNRSAGRGELSHDRASDPAARAHDERTRTVEATLRGQLVERLPVAHDRPPRVPAGRTAWLDA
jgi:hypothetical protein